MHFPPDLYGLMAVDLPEGECDGLSISRVRLPLRGAHPSPFVRATRPGVYTQVTDRGRPWLSDTDYERRAHMPALQRIQEYRAKRIVLNGLGLGMVLKAALTFRHVEHVDVVERDERLIKLVGSHYAKDSRVRIHQADAYCKVKKWRGGTKWDVGWSDLWGEPTEGDLPGMAYIGKSYGKRCSWHRCRWQYVSGFTY